MTNEEGFASPQQVRFAFSALALMLVLMSCSRVALAAEPTKRFDLPSQDLSSALIAFNHQSGVQTLFGYDASESIDHIRTGRVVGEFTAREALTRMLEGTGLQFRFYATNKIQVFRPAPAAQPQLLETGFQPTSYLTPIDEVHAFGRQPSIRLETPRLTRMGVFK